MKDLSDCTVMVVDDNETNIDVLVETLGNLYRLSVATDGETALELAAGDPPDLVLLDIMMPDMDGYEVCRRMKADARLCDIPIVFVTAMSEVQDETKGLALGAVDYITKPIAPAIVRARVKNHLELKLAREDLANQNVILEIKVRERTRELALVQEATIESMASLAESRDPETGGHIRRTQNYVAALARYLSNDPKYRDQLSPSAIELIQLSAPLHDVGKIGVPDRILLKPARLTPEEFEEMKKHTLYGRNAILKAQRTIGYNSFLSYARDIAYTHHEKWDGSGYPQGLEGEGIPLVGRLMALADVYDALVSKRPYKESMAHETALKLILLGNGTHFDPDIVAAFLTLSEEFRRIALENADRIEADSFEK